MSFLSLPLFLFTLDVSMAPKHKSTPAWIYSNMQGIDRSVPPFFTRVWGMHIPVTPQLVADVLHFPRIEFPNYPSYERLRTVSRDELMSSFCECLTAWGERLFTPCQPFAKGPKFMNMVMTFVLHPLSHYNSITEPRA